MSFLSSFILSEFSLSFEVIFNKFYSKYFWVLLLYYYGRGYKNGPDLWAYMLFEMLLCTFPIKEWSLFSHLLNAD